MNRPPDGRPLVAHGRSALRRDALRIARAGIAAADPARALREQVAVAADELVVAGHRHPLAGRRVLVAGAGKASHALAAALVGLLGDRIAAGVIAVRPEQARPLDRIEVLAASHPVPDVRSLVAGRRLMATAAAARPDDLLITLISGGSSSLAVLPVAGVSLADKIALNRMLLASGADIVEMNAVRKHVSALKGGRLAAACRGEVLNLSISDVVGDPVDVFISPAVPDPTTFADARAVCDRYDLWPCLPPSIAGRLRSARPEDETPKALERVSTHVLATSATMCAAAAVEASCLGYRPRIVGLGLVGDAAEGGAAFARDLAREGPGTALIAGGEMTVTLDRDRSSGVGGPSQEAALAAALELAESGPSCVLCMDSDGIDGPGDAAGGLVDDLTAAAGAEARVDIAGALAAHDSGTALGALGGLVVTGPTGTNVNDLKVGLRGGLEESGDQKVTVGS